MRALAIIFEILVLHNNHFDILQGISYIMDSRDVCHFELEKINCKGYVLEISKCDDKDMLFGSNINSSLCNFTYILKLSGYRIARLIL